MQHGVVHVINVFTCGSPEQSSHTYNIWFAAFSTYTGSKGRIVNAPMRSESLCVNNSSGLSPYSTEKQDKLVNFALKWYTLFTVLKKVINFY